jgi:hypothetical protein
VAAQVPHRNALAIAPGADRHVGPDQVMLDAMLDQMAERATPAAV